MKPNIRNLKKWVRALRSGKYKQGRGALNKNNKNFCCLGVVCEVAIKNKVKLKKTKNWSESKKSFTVHYDNEGGVLPIKVARWLGIDELNPLLKHQPASELNDQTKASFKQIADLVEEYMIGENNDL
jgi:hypothetical protein